MKDMHHVSVYMFMERMPNLQLINIALLKLILNIFKIFQFPFSAN